MTRAPNALASVIAVVASYFLATPHPSRTSLTKTRIPIASGEGDAETTRELELTLHRTISSEDSPPSELIYAGAAMRLLSHDPHGIAISVLREAARDLERISPLVASTASSRARRAFASARSRLLP